MEECTKEYKEQGYLSQAIANYLLLLGWSPKDNRQIIALKEAGDIFDIKNVNKTDDALGEGKLEWVNSEYIKNMENATLREHLEQYLSDKKFFPQGTEKEYIEKVAELFKTRLRKLSDFTTRAYFCFYDDYEFSVDGKEILIEASDLLARAFQHETDHLNGMLIIDHLSKVKRDMVVKKFRKLQLEKKEEV